MKDNLVSDRATLDGRQRLWCWLAQAAVIAALMVLAQPAAAQDCQAQDSDIFRTARRARTMVAAYTEMHRVHRADLARNEAFARQTDQELPWRFDLVGIATNESTFGFEVCTNRGPWGASVGPMSVGGLFSVDVYEWGVGVEAFALLVDEVLQADPTEAQTRTEDGQVTDPTGVATASAAEVMYGGRLTLHRWASVVVGYIESGSLNNVAGDDGRIIQLRAADTSRQPRWYVGAGSPLGDTSLHLVFEPEDVSADVVEVRSEAIPLPIDFDAVGVAAGSYIADESQVVLDLGLAEAFDVLTVVAAGEFNPVRLRSASARLDWAGGPQMILRDADPDTGRQSAMRLALDLGAFMQASYFNSRHLDEQTGRAHVAGAAFGLTARPDATILMGQLDLWFGLNQPETLARISEFVDHWQMGVRFHGRFGL
jgi:hypothetical protein